MPLNLSRYVLEVLLWKERINQVKSNTKTKPVSAQEWKAQTAKVLARRRAKGRKRLAD